MLKEDEPTDDDAVDNNTETLKHDRQSGRNLLADFIRGLFSKRVQHTFFMH
jgi:hypothetical protein